MINKQLQFARDITAQVKNEWVSGNFLEKVTPTTKNLLTYWFGEGYKDVRDLQFHEG